MKCLLFHYEHTGQNGFCGTEIECAKIVELYDVRISLCNERAFTNGKAFVADVCESVGICMARLDSRVKQKDF